MAEKKKTSDAETKAQGGHAPDKPEKAAPAEGAAAGGADEGKKKKGEKPEKAAKPEGGGDEGKKKKGDKGDKKAAEAPEQPAPPPRLWEHYNREVRVRLREKFKLKNVHQVPKLTKITVNMGVGKAIEKSKRLDAAIDDLSAITGQRPKMCTAKKSEANFKLREGMPIGAKVDLRGARMYEFFDRLVSVAIPRIRDFRGINRNSFDGRGNFSMGLAEQIVFPEVPLDKVEFNQGMDITMVISGGSDEMSLELLENLGMPFKRV
jgi:large subunit ribosomal protein L5